MGQKKRILLIEDDADTRDAIVEQFALVTDFAEVACASSKDILAGELEGDFSGVVVDVTCNCDEGGSIVERIRNRGVVAPIVLLADHTNKIEHLIGQSRLANDVIIKPFKFASLVAKLRLHIRQHDLSKDLSLPLGPYTFRPSQKSLTSGQECKILLTDKETNILEYLHNASGAIVAREELLQEVWGYATGVTTHTLETHIYQLRQKIEADPSNAALLLTERGGYRLQT